MVRPLVWAMAAAALAAGLFLPLWRHLLRPGVTTPAADIAAGPPAPPRPPARRVATFLTTSVAAADDGAPAGALGPLLAELARVADTADDEADDHQRAEARRAFLTATGLDAAGAGMFEAGVDRFASAMTEAAALLDEASRAPGDPGTRLEIAESAAAAYGRAIEELDSLVPTERRPPSWTPLLAGQLPALARRQLRRLPGPRP